MLIAAALRAAARRLAAARFVRSVVARAAVPGVVPPPVAAPEDALGPPARSAAGSRWHHEQKWVARAPMTIRRIGRPQRGHGSAVRW